MKNELTLNDEGHIIFIQDIRKILQDLYDQFRSVESQNEYLREENKRLKSENYKDEELSKMKEEYERMKEDYYRGFPISEEEHKKIKEWMESLPEVPLSKMGAIGGRFTYEFYPTSIGVSGTIRDSISGKSFNFQELG